MNILRYKQKSLGHVFREDGDGSGSFGGGTFSFSGASDAAAQAASATAGFNSIGASTPTNTGGINVNTGSGTGGSIAGGILGNLFGGPLGGLAGRAIGGYVSSNYNVGPNANGGYGNSYSGGGDPNTAGGRSGGSSMTDFLTNGSLGNVLSIAGGLNSIFGGNTIDKSAVNAADPMAPYRAGIAQQYAGALSGNLDLSKAPGFDLFTKGVVDPALAAVQRSAAASGTLGSAVTGDNMASSAQKNYYTFMTDYLNRLAGASGAGNNPVSGAQLGVNQGNASQQATMQGLGGIATGLQGLGGYFSSGGGSTGYSATAGSVYENVNTANLAGYTTGDAAATVDVGNVLEWA